MITGYYEGENFLELNNAFENVAWQAIYTHYTTYDPVIASLSNFKKICIEGGIEIDYSSKFLTKGINLDNIDFSFFPIIFFISGGSQNLDKILNWVEKGANLVYINNTETYIITGLAERNAETLSQISKITKSNLSSNNPIVSFGLGNIFYIEEGQVNDYGIERSPFSEVNLKVANDKKDLIKSLIKRFVKFNIPILSIKVNSFPSSFPVNEPMFIDLAVKNLGNTDFSKLNLAIDVSSNLEPISATYLELSGIKTNEISNIPLICKPLFKGDQQEFTLKAKVINSECVRKNYEVELKINILENLKNLLGNTIPTSIDTKTKIKELESYLVPTINGETFIRLLEIDPDALITKTRKIAEHTIKKIAQEKLSNFNSRWTLADLIKRLYDENVIDNKIRSYVDTIRLFGNMAAHTDIEEPVIFNIEDAVVVSNALILFLSECVKKRLI
ncbi:MAG: DUF4145 domain-containing protein [Thermonemataceae bacterium]|nr:DUF4145 domain-containing protein [Thermonemataceae bacterium]